MDKGLMANWVIASDTHREACEKAQKMGLIIKSPNKGIPMQNPYLPIINRQAEIMMRAASELGFSPTSRTRLTRLDDVAAPKILANEPMGKKEQADADAKTAAIGTDWDSLLQPDLRNLQ